MTLAPLLLLSGSKAGPRSRTTGPACGRKHRLRAGPGAALLRGSPAPRLRARRPGTADRTGREDEEGATAPWPHRPVRGTCRGRSRPRLPEQRRAAGRGRLRLNRRSLREWSSQASRGAPRFPPHNVSSGGKGKVWLSPLGLNFPARRCKSPPSATRQSPGLRPSVLPRETYSDCSRRH